MVSCNTNFIDFYAFFTNSGLFGLIVEKMIKNKSLRAPHFKELFDAWIK